MINTARATFRTGYCLSILLRKRLKTPRYNSKPKKKEITKADYNSNDEIDSLGIRAKNKSKTKKKIWLGACNEQLIEEKTTYCLYIMIENRTKTVKKREAYWQRG